MPAPNRNHDTVRPRLTTATLLAALAALLVTFTATPAMAAPSYAWSAEGCTSIIVVVPASADVIEPHVPDGFTPIIPDPVREMLPPDPRLEAAFGYEVFDCASETIGQRTATEVTYTSLWTFVEPPDHLADSQYPFAFYKWLTLIDDDTQRDLLARHGVPVTDGTGDTDRVTFTPAGAAYDATVTFDADASYRVTGTANNQLDVFEGDLIEYSALTDRPGYALWRVRYAAPTAFGGTGVASWDQDAYATEILGTTQAQAYILAADGFELTNGSITIQPGDRTVPTEGDIPPAEGTQRSQPDAATAPTSTPHTADREPVQAATSLPATGGGAAGLAAGVLLLAAGLTRPSGRAN